MKSKYKYSDKIAELSKIVCLVHPSTGSNACSICFLKMIVILAILLQVGCRKFVEVEPPATNITGASVFTSDATAAAVLTGIYTQISGTQYGEVGVPFISEFAGLSADELTLWSGTTYTELIACYTNALSVNIGGYEFWQSVFYPNIYICNSAIEGLAAANSLTPAVKQQLLGEAYFMRAFFYFYLVNLYGDVPLSLTSNYTTNESLSRTPKAQIYQQIVSDLKDAQAFLSTNYLDATLLNPTNQRVRPTLWAADALLARVYLYTGSYDSAEQQATAVINNTSTFSLTGLDNVFLMNSSEAIWQLQPVSNFNGITNTQDAFLFIIPPTGPNNYPGNPVYLSNNLLASFEIGDQRRQNWVDSIIVGADTFYFPYKYKVNSPNAPVSEYSMMFRLGEQYLIRAEARAMQKNIVGAQADLNMIRTRANLPNTNADDQNSLVTAITHERQVELFTELGQRWLDLKRTKTINMVMGPVCTQKGGAWNSNWALYPLPLADIQADQNLVQNPGY